MPRVDLDAYELLVNRPDQPTLRLSYGELLTRTSTTEDATALLLATHVGGVPLSPGHGAPTRLVAPGRRGFWWVKWVEQVSVEPQSRWLQSPFPLQ